MSFIEYLMNIINDLPTELLGALLAFLAGVLYTKSKEHFFTNRVYNHTRLKMNSKEEELLINSYHANSGATDSEEKTSLGYPFEYMSYATVVAYLQSINKNIDIALDPSPLKVSDIKNYSVTSNTILFGGPFHNLITGMIFGLSKEYRTVPFYFDRYGDEDAALFCDNKPDVPFIPLKNADGDYYMKDYGIILNVVNPYDTRKRIIAIIGCRSIGVFGASLYFAKSHKELKKKTKGMDNYAVIVVCGGDEHTVIGSPKLVLAVSIDPIDKSKISKSTLKDIAEAHYQKIAKETDESYASVQ